MFSFHTPGCEALKARLDPIHHPSCMPQHSDSQNEYLTFINRKQQTNSTWWHESDLGDVLKQR